MLIDVKFRSCCATSNSRLFSPNQHNNDITKDDKKKDNQADINKK